MAGLVREAIDQALDDAGSTFDDIDAVVVGKAPDFFEGVMMPELFLADALGAAGKPLLRVHTAGSVGGSTAIVAASLVQAGVHSACSRWPSRSSPSRTPCGRCRCRCRSPSRSARARAATSPRTSAPTSGARARPTHIGAMVAVKDRLNALKNPLRPPAPARHHRSSRCMASPMLWDPIRYDETCPSSDGACAMVIADEATADAEWPTATPRLDPRHRDAHRAARLRRARPGQPAGRPRRRGRRCGRQAGITDPIDEIDAAEIYVPFSWFEPMWLENLGFAPEGEGWKLTEAGATALDGRHPGQPVGRRAVVQPDRRLRA